MKITVFWNMTPCSTAGSNRRRGETRCLRLHSGRLWKGGNSFLRNSCTSLPQNMVHYPREHKVAFTKPTIRTSNVVIRLLAR